MTVTQGATVCYVDPSTGLGYSAGHCAVSNDVLDDAGDVVGRVVAARNNRTDRTAPTFVRPLVSDSAITPQPGMKVCHQGATTGRSCGAIAEVYDGWFTMTAGSGDLTSDHGDSGGPVYAMVPGRPQPVLLGLFRGSHGDELAAVTWADVRAYAADAA